MLQAHGLTKRYGGLLALDRVSFELHPGEIVGYLGPNGSGKSTTVNLVVGLLEPSAGDLSLSGIRASEDPIAYKRRIGYVPEEPSLYAHLTASDYLMHSLISRITRQGFPAAKTPSGTSRVTTLPAPMTARAPMFTPGRIIAPPPTQTSAPISIGLPNRQRFSGGPEQAPTEE